MVERETKTLRLCSSYKVENFTNCICDIRPVNTASDLTIDTSRQWFVKESNTGIIKAK